MTDRDSWSRVEQACSSDAIGSAVSQLKASGHTLEKVKKSGFPLQVTRQAGYTCADAHETIPALIFYLEKRMNPPKILVSMNPI